METYGDINVQVIPEEKFQRTSAKFNHPSTYYVVDPGKTKDSCDPPNIFQGKVIIVASPDEGHWGGSEFLKQRGNIKGLFMFMPVWSLSELLAAKQYFEYNLLDETIASRYEKVGGIPRHIFTDDDTFNAVLRSQISAINMLNEDQLRNRHLMIWIRLKHLIKAHRKAY